MRLPPRRPSQLTQVEARQKVLITSKDGQTATGDWAIFDVKANTVLMGDHVVVSRGKDVAEGPRLKIDLTTGMYRFELESEPAKRRAVAGHQRCARPHGARPLCPSQLAYGACVSPRQAVPAVLPQGGAGEGQGARSRRCFPTLPPPRRPMRLGAEHQRQPGAAEQLTAMRLFPFLAKKADADAGRPAARAATAPATARPGRWRRSIRSTAARAG